MPKRRGNKEGSIYKRSDGRWCAQVTDDNKRKYLYGKTRTEVAQKLLKYQTSNNKRSPITVEKHIKNWLAYMQTQVSLRTHDKREYEMLNYALPRIGKIKLVDLSVQDVADMQLDIYETVGATTAATCVKLLRQALKHGMILGILEKNVAQLVKLVKIDKQEIQPLNPDEVKAFLTTLEDHWHYPLFYLAISNGIRIGELLSLEWACVFEDHIMIKRSITRVGGKVMVGSVKTKNSNRASPLAPGTFQMLLSHKQKQQEMIKAGMFQDNGLVFPNTLGKLENPSNIRRTLLMIQEKAGLRQFRFHDLRHTFASMQIKLGKDPKSVADLLGHSRASFTLDTYTHLFEQQHKKKVDSLEDMLKKLEDDSKNDSN